MKKKIVFLLSATIFLLSFSGCVFKTHGESLGAFSERMNEYNQSYNMTADGYIIDSVNSSFTKFFKFHKNELMLEFKYDKKYRLCEMHLVFPVSLTDESYEAYSFILNAIKSFCINETTANSLLESTSFDKAIKTISKKTIQAELDGITIEIDTTQLGTVVSLYKDI